MSIQILQYEFLGPISLDEWGPPMEKLVYLILSRDKDKFNILYVGDCSKTDEKSFFVQHPNLKCWVKHSGSEKSLFLAILPLFDSSDIHRKNILNKIMIHYKPPCNLDDLPQIKPDYLVRKSEKSEPKYVCPCCGSDMKSEQILEKSTIFRCVNCGLSDTKLNC
ncbi:MAG: hypothetical protein OEL56_03880 [Nitrosopumilus sp.]|nr:hypothetical protein [Nitrosopumilus sp.]MDH3489567.1 hypothetical protein [Nitrosopumilus sp.]MDH3516565.1 hypothetical protein [Nitrosopumilus sp.]MDH3565032.1 hypothetical protein [Nitrosopumilus sp.]MDH5416455.1 hypothetical protein [Nitrosopumilus sp.]